MLGTRWVSAGLAQRRLSTDVSHCIPIVSPSLAPGVPLAQRTGCILSGPSTREGEIYGL